VPRVAGALVVSGFNNGRVGAYNLAPASAEIAIANPAAAPSSTLVDVGAGLSVVGNDVYWSATRGARSASICRRA